jgi:hypothetical protein
MDDSKDQERKEPAMIAEFHQDRRVNPHKAKAKIRRK